jgi:hypothetical protein
MLRAQTRILGLFEDWRIEWTASRVSDFMIRIRGIIGAGVGLMLELEITVSRAEIAVDDDCFANACEMEEYRRSSVFLIPFKAKEWDFRSVGIVALIVSFASFARAPLFSHGRMSDLEEDAILTNGSQGQLSQFR